MRRAAWYELLADDLATLKDDHLLRELPTFTPIDATHVECDGRRFVNFASNDYLGLTHHPRLIQAGRDALSKYGSGSGAAPLIYGHGPLHVTAEQALARWKGVAAALLLPSGYQANHAVVQALSGLAAGGRRASGVRFLVDKLAHASLIDAVRGSGAAFRIFPHNHLAKLRRLLSDAPAGQLQVVVTESIFSMDGDAAPLADLVQLREEFGFFLLLDEAHASGVYGPNGAGLASELGLGEHVDASVVTFSKALGGVGGAICADRSFRDLVINRGRAFIFSTAVPPHIAAIVTAAVDVLRYEPARQERVRERARRVRQRLREAGVTVRDGDSPIVPVITGSAESALRTADQLRARGMLVAAVRPPTVARNESRLRVTLSSEHEEGEVDELIAAIIQCTTRSPG